MGGATPDRTRPRNAQTPLRCSPTPSIPGDGEAVTATDPQQTHSYLCVPPERAWVNMQASCASEQNRREAGLYASTYVGEA